MQLRDVMSSVSSPVCVIFWSRHLLVFLDRHILDLRGHWLGSGSAGWSGSWSEGWSRGCFKCVNLVWCQKGSCGSRHELLEWNERG